MGTVVYKTGDDVSTDAIYPGRFMATVLPTETPQFCFADEKEFNKMLNSGTVNPGSIVLGGNNFGCGSSREQAASTLKGHGLIVVAKNFARIFLQNGVNLGLQMVVCPDIEAEAGDELEILEDAVLNKRTGKKFSTIPHAAARLAIINAGGLIPYARERLVAERTA